MNKPKPPATRALGIDFGERRIGLALSDPAGRYALPLEVVERRSDRRAVYRIAAIARREDVGLLVLGDPHRPSGEPSSSRERVRRFGRKLMRATGLPLRLVDEALTTDEARRRLARIGADRRSAEERRDMVAAQILLQEALDGGGRPLEAAPAAGVER